MPAIRSNFCPCCGGALSRDGKALESHAVNCARCRRTLVQLRQTTRTRRWTSIVIAASVLGVAGAISIFFVAQPTIAPPVMVHARTFEPATPLPAPPTVVIPAPPTVSAPVTIPQPPTTPQPPSAPVAPAPPAPIVPTRDPLIYGWHGSFLLHTRANGATIYINGQSFFHTTQAGTFITPQATLHRNDRVVFAISAPSGVMRAAFFTDDGPQQITLRAADLRDVADKTDFSPLEFASNHDVPATLGKIPEAEFNEWENAGAHPTPHGSEFINGKDARAYHVGFIVGPQLARPLKASRLTDRRLYLFDNTARMMADWKWKANFTMNADGATGPPEPDNELVSRFLLDGDFTVDLDADFGQAAYTNTGGMLVGVCRQEIGFDGGWNFGSWGGTSVHIRVQRRGDELQLLRDGQVLIAPIPDAERDQPTPWRLWWRSRSSHFQAIKVSAERIIDPEGAGNRSGR